MDRLHPDNVDDDVQQRVEYPSTNGGLPALEAARLWPSAGQRVDATKMVLVSLPFRKRDCNPATASTPTKPLTTLR